MTPMEMNRAPCLSCDLHVWKLVAGASLMRYIPSRWLKQLSHWWAEPHVGLYEH